MNSFYPTEPTKFRTFFVNYFHILKEVIFSKLMFLILAQAIMSIVGLLFITPTAFVNNLKEMVIGDLINKILDNPGACILYLTLWIFSLFINVAFIHAVDTYLKTKSINHKQILRFSLSRLVPFMAVSIISTFFALSAFIPILLKAENIALYFPLLMMASFVFSIVFFFSNILIVIKNISVIEAFSNSWRLIGFKYFILVALGLVAYGQMGKINFMLINKLSAYPYFLTIISLTIFGFFSSPIFYCFKLLLLNEFSIRRSKISAKLVLNSQA